MAYYINKRTSDPKIGLAPAALGDGLTGVLVDHNSQPVGSPFPVKMSVASGGTTQNENTVTVMADRTAFVSAVLLERGGNKLASVALTMGASVKAGDTVEFVPGAMAITVDGPFSDMLLSSLVGPQYVIDEEPSLDDA